MNIFQEAKQILDKDGKVNPLGPYGKSKLTGQEVASYFRKNKVSDPQVKKAVEVALDLGGAYDIARKEIAKFFGDKILKSKEVQYALKFANEEVVAEGKLGEKKNYKYSKNFFSNDRNDKLKNISDRDGYGEIELGHYLAQKAELKNPDNLYFDDDELVYGSKTIVRGVYDKSISQLLDVVKKIKEEVVTEGKLDDSIIRRDFPNVWAASAKDKEILKKFHAKVDTKNYKEMKDAYKKDMKKFVDDLKKVKLSDLLKSMKIKGGKWDGWMTDEVQKESVMNAYRKMWEDGSLQEEVANITVDPRNRISKPADQNKHSNEIVKQARRFGLKASQMGKHVRIKGAKKAVNDFLRIIIGKSSYGDPTEKDMSTPQIDKMLTKDLK